MKKSILFIFIHDVGLKSQLFILNCVWMNTVLEFEISNGGSVIQLSIMLVYVFFLVDSDLLLCFTLCVS